MSGDMTGEEEPHLQGEGSCLCCRPLPGTSLAQSKCWVTVITATAGSVIPSQTRLCVHEWEGRECCPMRGLGSLWPWGNGRAPEVWRGPAQACGRQKKTSQQADKPSLFVKYFPNLLISVPA